MYSRGKFCANSREKYVWFYLLNGTKKTYARGQQELCTYIANMISGKQNSERTSKERPIFNNPNLYTSLKSILI